MKLLISGGTGQLGTLAARAFQARGDEVVVLSRNPGSAPWRVIAWDARTPGPWHTEFDGADVVLNLAGRSVNCRYSRRNREQILQSRLESTRAVGEAIAGASRPPRVWLQASTATIYAHRFDAPNNEAEGLIGGSEPGVPDTWNFSIEVAHAWERAMDETITPSTRKVALRAAMVMSPDPGGVFDVLLGLVRKGLGGAAGSGRQFVSWIHEHDFLQSLLWIIDHPDLAGPVNLAAPEPLPNADFMRILRRAWGMPVGLPAPAWMIEIGTFLMRTESELVLKSRRVIPRRLLESGFEFQFPNWESAARDLCDRYRHRSVVA